MDADDGPDYPAANTLPMDAMAVLQLAVLGTFEVFLEDLSFNFSKGTRQRQVDEQLINDLVENYRRVGVLNHDFRYFVILMVDGEKFRAFADETKLEYGAWGSAQLVSANALKVKGLKKHNGAVFEVQAGQHRLRALERYRREELSPRVPEKLLEDLVRDSVSWVGIVLDSAQMTPTRLIALELIRLNPEEVRVPDSEEDVWNKWLSLEEIKAKCQDKDERAMLKKNHQIIHLASVGAKVTRRFSRLWLYPQLKSTISRFLRYSVYRATFKSILWEYVIVQKRITWFYEAFLHDWEQLLVDAFADCPEGFDEASFDAIQNLPLPRTEKAVRDLLYPNGARSTELLTLLNDKQFEETCTSLATENLQVPLTSFKDLHHIGKTKANTLQELMLHLCRWVDPRCFMEGQSKREKASAEDVWRPQLNRRSRSGIINKIDNIDIAMQSLGLAISKIVDECGDISPDDLKPETLNGPKAEYQNASIVLLDHGSVKALKPAFFNKKIAAHIAKSNKAVKGPKEPKSTSASPKKRKTRTANEFEESDDLVNIADENANSGSDCDNAPDNAPDPALETAVATKSTKTSKPPKKSSSRKGKNDGSSTSSAGENGGKNKEVIVDSDNIVKKAVVTTILTFRRTAKGHLPKARSKNFRELEGDLTLLYASWTKKLCTQFIEKANQGKDCSKLFPFGIEDLDTALTLMEDVVRDCDEMNAVVARDRANGDEDVEQDGDVEEPPEVEATNLRVAKSQKGAEAAKKGSENSAATSVNTSATTAGMTAPFTQVSSIDLERGQPQLPQSQDTEIDHTQASLATQSSPNTLPLRTTSTLTPTSRQLRKRPNMDAENQEEVRQAKKSNHGQGKDFQSPSPILQVAASSPPQSTRSAPKSFGDLNKSIVNKATIGKKKRIMSQRPQDEEEDAE
ncbi:hypothetical protein DFH27DRAFT_529208 [Peziza echinospora]|nr:hypothetical protein DFH27DRAFT_529208 [Peziza echinospora]